MTINEKLNLISDLERSNFNSKTIETIVESVEHPETLNGPFNNVDELWKVVDRELADAKN